MSVLKYFKNIPRSPPIGRQALSVIFFLHIRNEVPGQKKRGHVAHPTGDRGACRLSPRPPRVTGVPPLYKDSTPIPSSFQPENSSKNPEKKERGEEKGNGEALPDCAFVICR